jgi:hypothetical protein
MSEKAKLVKVRLGKWTKDQKLTHRGSKNNPSEKFVVVAPPCQYNHSETVLFDEL